MSGSGEAIGRTPPTPGLRRRIRKSSLYRAATLLPRLVRILLLRHRCDQVVIHSAKLTRNVPPALVVHLLCGNNRGRFSKPDNLAIVLVHNRQRKTLMEQSLDYLGIADYTVLPAPSERPWTHTTRITRILEYLKSGACTAEYLLSVDCDDAVLNRDPAIAIDLLNAAECDMLVSATAYDRYRNMPEVRAQTIALAPEALRNGRRPRIHLNAGVFVTRTAFLAEYLAEAAKYVTPDDLPSDRLGTMSDAEVAARLPDFPRGVGSDQTIMRYLFPRFHPRMKIDYANRLAAR